MIKAFAKVAALWRRRFRTFPSGSRVRLKQSGRLATVMRGPVDGAPWYLIEVDGRKPSPLPGVHPDWFCAYPNDVGAAE